MSLEDALNRNSDLLEEHNTLLKQVLSKAGVNSASNDARDGKTTTTTGAKRGPKPKTAADNDEATGPTFATLKADLAAWLGEFAKEEDKENPDGAHPEVQARKDAVGKAFASDKIGIKKLTDLGADDTVKIAALHTWLHEKAKKADKGFGIGRFAADPAPADEADDDDIGV